MKTSLSVLFLFFIIMMSCRQDDDIVTSSTSSNSATTPTTLSTGSIIAFNPKIEVTGATTCTFDNSMQTESKLPATAGPVDCNLSFAQTAENLDLILENKTLFGESNLKLTLNSFKDMGNDGYSDEFSVSAEHNGSSIEQKGQFIGSQKPRNNNITEEKLVDISGAPTKEEFSNFIVGNSIFLEHTYGMFALIKFIDSSNAEYRSGYKDLSYDEDPTYSYDQSSDTVGKLIFNWDGDLVNVEVTFQTFYTGTWKQTDGSESGNFNVYTDASMLIE
jgi:hypothetical protein